MAFSLGARDPPRLLVMIYDQRLMSVVLNTLHEWYITHMYLSCIPCSFLWIVKESCPSFIYLGWSVTRDADIRDASSFLSMSDWSFSLRKGHAGGFDSEDDSDDGHNPLSAPLIRAERVNEDAVQFRESPWTIAKLHAVNKRPPSPPAAHNKKAWQTSSSPKSTATTKKRPATAKRQATLQDAFRKQARRPPTKAAPNPTTKTSLLKNSSQTTSKSEPSHAPAALCAITKSPSIQSPGEKIKSPQKHPASSQGHKENARPSSQNTSRRNAYVPALPVLRPEGLHRNSASPASPSAFPLNRKPTPAPPQASMSRSPVLQPYTDTEHDRSSESNISDIARDRAHHGMHIYPEMISVQLVF